MKPTTPKKSTRVDTIRDIILLGITLVAIYWLLAPDKAKLPYPVSLADLLSPLYYDMLNATDLWVQHVSGNLFLILLRRIGLAMLLILVMAAGHQIILSHRFCGPLVNFGHTFDRMLQGDYSRKVHLRKNDFLKAEAARVNAIIDRLNTDGQELRMCMDQMAETVMRLQKLHLPNETALLVDSLYEPVEACRKTLLTRVRHSLDH